MLERQRSVSHTVKQELADIGRLERRRNRAAVKELEGRIEHASEATISLESSIEETDRQMREVKEAQALREGWLLENAPMVRRLDALGRELWWREQHQALAAEVAMPQYLINAVGERPMKPSDRGAWREAVKAIESYRDRWGVADTDQALGDESSVESDQQVERDSVLRSLGSLNEVSSAIDVDARERSLEL
jgi:hypothetical protein